jgi:hypothetical protein
LLPTLRETNLGSAVPVARIKRNVDLIRPKSSQIDLVFSMSCRGCPRTL